MVQRYVNVIRSNMLRTIVKERIKLIRAGNIDGDRAYTRAQRNLYDALVLIHYRLAPAPTTKNGAIELLKAWYSEYEDFSKKLIPRYDGTDDQMRVFLRSRVESANEEVTRLLSDPSKIPVNLRAGLDFLHKAK